MLAAYNTAARDEDDILRASAIGGFGLGIFWRKIALRNERMEEKGQGKTVRDLGETKGIIQATRIRLLPRPQASHHRLCRAE